MSYVPMTEDEALAEKKKAEDSRLPWPNGEYSFEVEESTEKTSNNGNLMYELDLVFINDNGATKKVRDWLMFSGGMVYKTRHACAAVGLLGRYEMGNLMDADFKNKRGRATLKTEKGKAIPGKPGEFYYDKNVVEDYTPDAKSKLVPAGMKTPIDDEIPF